MGLEIFSLFSNICLITSLRCKERIINIEPPEIFSNDCLTMTDLNNSRKTLKPASCHQFTVSFLTAEVVALLVSYVFVEVSEGRTGGRLTYFGLSQSSAYNLLTEERFSLEV